MLPMALAIIAHGAMLASGMIFLTAGVHKWRHRQILPGVIANYRILPVGLVGPASALLPPAEMVIGALLLVGPFSLVNAAASVLLLSFAVATAINLLRGRSHIHCGCGRLDLQQQLGWGAVLRNLLLAALLLIPAAFGQPLDAMAHASALFTGLAIWVANMLFEAISAAKAAAPALASHHAPTHNHAPHRSH